MSKKTISPDSFAMICFLVLMQNGDGLSDKSPDYITEKVRMLGAGLDAFGYLDIHNMQKVEDWCMKWGIGMDFKIVKELNLQRAAAADLGIDI